MKLHTQSINIAKSFQTQTLHTDTVRSYSPLDCHYRNLSAGAVIKDSVELCTCACAPELFQTLSKAPFTLVRTCLQIRMAYQCEHTECALQKRTTFKYVRIKISDIRVENEMLAKVFAYAAKPVWCRRTCVLPSKLATICHVGVILEPMKPVC